MPSPTHSTIGHTNRPSSYRLVACACTACVLVVGVAANAEAYIGPGAGFALLTSLFVLVTTVAAALVSLVAWPLRFVWRRLRRGPRPTALVGRLIVIGFDGQEPKLTDTWLAQGKLPNFARIAAMGCYHRLRTTCPAISPVAWASFSTGTNPAKHNIFDFINRDPRTYLPVPSSTRITNATRAVRIGRYRIPLERPRFELLRRSEPFWRLLGEHRIWSTILRVPITFPPDRFYGAELSAMAVPDLLGTQGAFVRFTTRVTGVRPTPSGTEIGIVFDDDTAMCEMPGPDNPFRVDSPPIGLPVRIVLDRAPGRARLHVSGQVVDLAIGVLSPWVTLTFRAAPLASIRGLCRFLLTELGAEVSVYVTPIGIDPDRPAMPISHPSYYATYLSNKIGRYSTLGLAEDTGALNEGVIDDASFLQLTHDIDDERQRMFLAALDRLRGGVLVCVFDATDRIQHMFWRTLDPTHPYHRRAVGAVPGDDSLNDASPDAIEQLYRRNDALLGRILERVGSDDVLMVISDHGFSSFRRGVNLNGWLRDRGLLTLRTGADGASEWLRDVDWSKTKAYAMGLAGIFLNMEGREAQGVVAQDEAHVLKAELSAALRGLVDADTGEIGIRDVFDSAAVYDGPYADNAPDLVMGYNHGYRVSWSSAMGKVVGPVFEDNVRAWSGDHGIDPRLVPGVFFCNRPIDADDPALIDIAPTALTLFGVEPPPHMDGRPLFRARVT